MKQNFDGNFVENGAIYIFKLKNFNKFKNNSTGKLEHILCLKTVLLK